MESKLQLPETSPPPAVLGAFNELLTRPPALLERMNGGGQRIAMGLLAGSVVGIALYGAAAGFFQGGGQILVAALKAPLIVFGTLLLCLPSLYVFSAAAGARWSPRGFLALLAGFAGTLSLVLLGLLPVAWLFSVTSRYLGSVVFFQLLLWVVALALAWRFLGQAAAASGARRGALLLWLALFAVVSLQVVTVLRPVLARKPGEALFAGGKKSFLEHFGDALRAPAQGEDPQASAEGTD
jgi:hypothetical protein